MWKALTIDSKAADTCSVIGMMASDPQSKQLHWGKNIYAWKAMQFWDQESDPSRTILANEGGTWAPSASEKVSKNQMIVSWLQGPTGPI